MSQELVKKPSEETQLEIITMIHSGEINTAEDINLNFPSLSIEEAVALLNDEEFYLRICNHTTARVKLLYHTKGIKALDKALTHGNHSEAMAAYDRVAKAVGADGSRKEKRPMNFNFFSLEEVIESSKGEKVVKGRVVKPAAIDITPSKKFKPGLNYASHPKVNGNIFESGGEEEYEEADTIYIDEGYEGDEEWDED